MHFDDDAIRTIKLMVGYIADQVIDGLNQRKGDDAVDLPPVPAEAAEEVVELSDEELLGASTLSKIEAAAEAEEAAADDDEETAEEDGGTEEAVAEEAEEAVESAEEAEETEEAEEAEAEDKEEEQE